MRKSSLILIAFIVSVLELNAQEQQKGINNGFRFGFEFFMSTFNNYFIEIGAIGTGTRTDKIATQAIYSNGLLISTGFRFYLK